MEPVKRRGALLAVVTAAAVIVSGAATVATYNGVKAAADDAVNVGRTYYYDELGNSELAQKFYGAIDEMARSGGFKDGTYEYDLTAVVTQTQLDEYLINRKPTIPVAFGAARDAYCMDHPELFYADVYKINVTAGSMNGKDFISAGTGYADNYFADDTFTSSEQVNAAITEFNKAVASAVAAARAGGTDVVSQIKSVNKYIAESTKYDYNYGITGKNGTVTYDGHIYTAYGALVKRKAVCEGYAKAFKVVMDELGIPCVVVNGAVNSGIAASNSPDGTAPHAWNAVEVDGLWYGVDVTYNVDQKDINKYTLIGGDKLGVDHFEDGVVSSSGFELKYPVLRPLDYGEVEDGSGFEFKDSGTLKVNGKDTAFGYSQSGEDDPTLVLGVSYEGKDAGQLRKEGKYFAYRLVYDDEGGASGWMELDSYNKVFEFASYVDGYNVMTFYPTMYRVEFAVIDYAPDMGMFDDKEEVLFAYKPEKLTSDHIVSKSTGYTNKAYSLSFLLPFATKVTPNEHGYIMSVSPLDISLAYDEKLVMSDGSAVDASKINLVVRDGKDEVVEGRVSNIRWSEDENKLTFRFAPYTTYNRNCERYNFTPVNLKGAKSGRVPAAGGYLAFKLEEVICPKVFNDGRLYLKVFGQPQFISATDESENGFADEYGQPIAGNERTQLMLVVNKPTESENAEMTNKAESTFGDNIKASETYQISLQMCGKITKVPDGSYMQVGFGFPEGYGPEDAGVEFVCYHYTRNADGTVKSVEKIPCVVTEVGIIATVKSFSPFMICAVEKGNSATKNVYASVNGVGGKIKNAEIRQVAEGGTAKFEIVKNKGYSINSVLLNGADVTSKVDANGALTLTYAELTGGVRANDNVLEVSFISDRVKKYNADNNIVVKTPNIVVTDADMIKAKPHTEGVTAPPQKSNVGLIVGIVVAVVAVLAGAVVALYFLVFRKKKPAAEKAAASKSSSKSASKPANKPTATAAPKSEAASTRTMSATAKPAASTAIKPTTPPARTASTAAPAKPSGTSTARTTSSAATRQTDTGSNRSASTSAAKPTTASARPASTARTTASTARPSSTSTTRPSASASAKPATTVRPSATATKPSGTSSAKSTAAQPKKPISRNAVDNNKK